MRTRSPNPLLPRKPKNQLIRWRTGPSAGTVGLPLVKAWCEQLGSESVPANEAIVYTKDPRGRKPKDRTSAPSHSPISGDLREARAARAHPDAGKLSFYVGPFLAESESGWGANLDMVGLAHGPVGCGVFSQAARLNLPGFTQGIESFTALHACTDLCTQDLDDGGDAKLTRALAEIETLFPLARGVTILSEDPIALVDANIKGIAKATTKETSKLIVPLSCENIRVESNWGTRTVTNLKAALTCRPPLTDRRYNVALPFHRHASGLVWLVAKLLRDIGLEPVHEITGSCTSDMARISKCKLVIGFAPKLDVPMDYLQGGAAQLLRQWFGMDLVWTCFAGPSATAASLRAIAAKFDHRIQRRAENVIAANSRKVEAVIARYRPRLQDKLVLHFWPITDEELEPYRLLGFRIGSATGWPGKTGKWRTPRLVCDPELPNEKAMDSYIAEAKPDLVLDVQRDAYEWRKRGQTTLSPSPFYSYRGNAFWTYDGFACFAAALDRVVNNPWRKLLKPPWPPADG